MDPQVDLSGWLSASPFLSGKLMLPALPNVAILRFSGLSILPLLRGILWGLLGQAAARGGVSMAGPIPRGGLWVSPPLRRRGMAAPSDLNRTLQRTQHGTRSASVSPPRLATRCKATAQTKFQPSSCRRLRQERRQVF